MRLYKFCRLCIKEAEKNRDNYFNNNCEFAIKYKYLLEELQDRNLIFFNKGLYYWRITYQTKFKARFYLSISEISSLLSIAIFFFSLVQFIFLFK